MKKTIGIVRRTLIKEPFFSVDSQVRALNTFGCDEIIEDKRVKLAGNTTIIKRLSKLGLWEKLSELTHGGLIIATDASRVIRSYLELPTLIAKLSEFEVTIKFMRDDFDSSNDGTVVNILERMEYTQKTTKLEALKAGLAVYNSANPYPGPVFSKNLSQCVEIAQILRDGSSVVDASVEHECAASWIYWKGLHMPEVRVFYLHLTPDQVASDSRTLHETAAKIAKAARKVGKDGIPSVHRV